MSIQQHGERYSYSKMEFQDIFTSAKIVCTKHGGFFQVPRDHYRGSGCPKCISSRGENMVRLILQKHDIDFSEQKIFEGFIHKSQLKCDFYLVEYNTVIEFNGQQHYLLIDLFGGIYGLKQTQLRDKLKYEFLIENEINLIIIKYDENNIEETILDFLHSLK